MTKDMLETLRRIARGSESESLYIRKNEKRSPEHAAGQSPPYEKNEINEISLQHHPRVACALCGTVIAERFPTYWGGDMVHRACGESAFAGARAAHPAAYRHWLADDSQ